MIVAFTDPGDRLREYAADPRHAEHIVEELVPVLEERYPREITAGDRAVTLNLLQPSDEEAVAAVVGADARS